MCMHNAREAFASSTTLHVKDLLVMEMFSSLYNIFFGISHFHTCIITVPFDMWHHEIVTELPVVWTSQKLHDCIQSTISVDFVAKGLRARTPAIGPILTMQH